MKILVTGSRGMLGTDLLATFEERHDVLGCDLHNCDILQADQVDQLVASYRPEVIIHTAAYTNVDQAESDRETALRLNETGTRHIATAANTYHSKVVYISTDYVFDGSQQRPYTEETPPCPLGVYGETKLKGEQQIQQILRSPQSSPDGEQQFLIVRTAWLYGLHGNNFVSAIVRAAQQQDCLRVVNDQTGSPTYTQDLARGILALVEHNASGIVHLANSGRCTWYGFASAILDYAGITDVSIEPLTTEELGRPAPRPKFSVLDTSRFTALTGQNIRHWKEGLQAYFEELRRDM